MVRLIKKTTEASKDVYACTFYGTEKCFIHTSACKDVKKVTGCSNCPVLAAIFNKLYLLEDAMEGENQRERKTKI